MVAKLHKKNENTKLSVLYSFLDYYGVFAMQKSFGDHSFTIDISIIIIKKNHNHLLVAILLVYFTFQTFSTMPLKPCENDGAQRKRELFIQPYLLSAGASN